MRIVHCFRSPVGGIFRHVRDLAQAQHANGHEVAIVCDSTTGGAHEDRLFDAVRPHASLGIHRTAMQRQVGIGDAVSALATFRTIRRLEPDILHGHGAKGGFFARSFGTLMRGAGRRVARLYSPHGGVLHYDPASARGRAFFLTERQMERATDHLLFVSDHERRTYVAKIGEPRCASGLVYNGLQEAEFEPVATVPGAADFLYIGMMRDLKGPDLFIEAIADLRNSHPEIRAVMVGDGDDLPRYKTRVAELSLDVAFHPAMPARQAFGLASAMVVPSRAEAMPYIVLEALAAGRPMIATAVGGIPEILGARSLALAEPAVADLAAKMRWALENPRALAQAMPATAELHARFSAAGMAERIEQIYRESLSPK